MMLRFPVAVRRSSARLILVTLLLIALLMMGGSARADAMPLLVLRPIVVIVGVMLAWTPGPWCWSPLRIPAILLAALAAMMVVQLVPLPSALWLAAPGHAPFAEAAAAAGQAQPWRPLSLDPDATLNALIALLPAAVALMALAALGARERRALISIIVALAVTSALVGLLQLLGGANSPFYVYQITSRGLAVGLFANRNHQAALLAATLPMLAAWLRGRPDDLRPTPLRMTVAGMLGVLLLMMILATGSRSGTVLGAAATVVAVLLLPPLRPRTRGRRWLAWGAVAMVPVAAVGLAWLAGRAYALARFAGGDDLAGEQRLSALPLLVSTTRRFMPFGTGYGSFDPVFRTIEPDAMLATNYFNHAHNDLVELALTGGLGGLVLLALLVVWLCRGTSLAWRGDAGARPVRLAAAAAAAVLLLAGLSDYPLRTPTLSAIFVLACGLIVMPLAGTRQAGGMGGAVAIPGSSG